MPSSDVDTGVDDRYGGPERLERMDIVGEPGMLWVNAVEPAVALDSRWRD